MTSMATVTAIYTGPERAQRYERTGVGTPPVDRHRLLFLTIFLFVPLAFVFAQAFAKGIGVYLAAIVDDDALAAIRLTLLAAAIAVPLNLVFGIAAAWAIAKFRFPGKNVLTTLIDLPFSVSPVVAGLIYVLVFSLQGWLAGGCASTTSR